MPGQSSNSGVLPATYTSTSIVGSGGGASGGGGSFSVAGGAGTNSITWASNFKIAPTTSLRVHGNSPEIVLDDDTKIDLKLLARVLVEIKDVLCIIREDREKMERYPALKEAYEMFKVIDVLTEKTYSGD